MSIKTVEGGMTVTNAKFCVVVSRWNSFVVESLEKGAVDTLVRHGAKEKDVTVVRVPGAFEMPLVLEKIAAKGGYDAIVALGAVIRGGTLLATVELLKQADCKKITGLFLVAAPEGIKKITSAHPDVDIVTASVDEKLNEKGYILPGLGDAGDKIFGTK